MKKLLILFFLIILSSQVPAQNSGTPTLKNVTLKNTETRPFHSKITGREYLLYISYPDSYFSRHEKKYPVLYTTDAYWNFSLMCTIEGSLTASQQVPEYLVVGIGYAGDSIDVGKARMYELSPNRQDYGWAALGDGLSNKMGGSRLFLNAIKEEIIPYVQSNFRVDTSFRALLGASMGGLFSLYAMYEEPGLFQGIISVSPVVDWNHCWLFKRESELRWKAEGNDKSKGYSLNARLYMAVGGAEDHQFIGGIKAFNEIILDAEYQNFDYKFQVVKDEVHTTAGIVAFLKGIKFVFKGGK